MKKIINKIQNIIPMTFGNLILFVIIIYLMSVVGKTVWDNYQSNKGISEEEQKLSSLEYEVEYTENEISYYKSDSFKEKQARAKLGYVLPGEKIISLPKDTVESEITEVQSVGDIGRHGKIPNYYLWYDYFFKNQ